VSEDMRVYDVLFGEYVTQIQLSDEDATRLGLMVEDDKPTPPPEQERRGK
jgi:hypothetical protein